MKVDLNTYGFIGPFRALKALYALEAFKASRFCMYSNFEHSMSCLVAASSHTSFNRAFVSHSHPLKATARNPITEQKEEEPKYDIQQITKRVYTYIDLSSSSLPLQVLEAYISE